MIFIPIYYYCQNPPNIIAFNYFCFTFISDFAGDVRESGRIRFHDGGHNNVEIQSPEYRTLYWSLFRQTSPIYCFGASFWRRLEKLSS